jgi:hypothetical protein
MKVLFLDNDGVICLSDNWGTRHKKLRKWMAKNGYKASYDMDHRFDNFDTKAIGVLNDILTETGAEYVISSDWRYHATLEELQGYYLSKGVIKAPIDMTPHTKDIDPAWWNRFHNYAHIEHERVIEIKYWLSQNPEVTHWVAVDDLNLGVYGKKPFENEIFNPDGLTNFVLTPNSNEGIKQTGKKEKIIKYLK